MSNFIAIYCSICGFLTLILSVHESSFEGSSVSGLFFALGYVVFFFNQKLEELKGVISEKK